ncbi:hypothetical protein, partial [Nonomuraea sp. NPDC003804]|uniref:hypothetical protein n=1 Tax=Nonomuraea sp. NPDC003804 TaxID=3154547 RepID=UPI0033B63FB8
GNREPLNKNEENKKNDDGLNVRQRIIDIYSKVAASAGIQAACPKAHATYSSDVSTVLARRPSRSGRPGTSNPFPM